MRFFFVALVMIVIAQGVAHGQEDAGGENTLEKAVKAKPAQTATSSAMPGDTFKETGRSSDGRYIDNGKGVIEDTQTGLMWTRKDSYADLGKCLDWNKSKSYVDNLTTGGYSDWRFPAIKELKTIFEKSKSLESHTKDSKYPLHLDTIFAPGGAYGYWSSEEAGPCCVRYLQFNFGNVGKRDRANCPYRGVRAVRSP